jgi:hypothetical protein
MPIQYSPKTRRLRGRSPQSDYLIKQVEEEQKALVCEIKFAGTAVVQVMVAVVVVLVAVTALIHDCAKADGATRKTNRRGTDTKRTRIKSR